MKKVLAHYSIFKSIWILMFTIGVGVGVFYFTIWFDGGRILKYAEERHRGYRLPLLFVGWICGGVTFAASMTLLKRFICGNFEALWIEDGRLIFFHRWALSVKCANIEDVSWGTSKGMKRWNIILRTRGGGQMSIPTGALKETKEIIFERLKAEL